MRTKGRGSRKQIRQIKKGEYIVWRDKKGRVRKPRSSLLLIAEVRSRKTGKRVGFLNKIEKGKIVPRRFVSGQRAFAKTPHAEPSPRKRLREEFSFDIFSSDMIQNQIPRELFDLIIDTIKTDDWVQVHFDLSTKRGEYTRTVGIYFDDPKMGFDFFTNSVVHAILSGLNELNIRMSPKKFATRRLRRNITRKMNVSVRFAYRG